MDSLKQNLYIAKIISSLLKDEITREQKLILEKWLNSDPSNRVLFDRMMDHEQLALSLQEWLTEHQDPHRTDRAWDRMKNKMNDLNIQNNPTRLKKTTTWYWISAAAIFLVACTVIIHWFSTSNEYKETIQTPDNLATLTLSDGRTINLNTQQNGIILGETLVYSDGSLVLNESHSVGASKFQLTTPRGIQYQIVLPDGSKVWLNTESSLTYELAQDQKNRVVHLSGEAYFEVAKQANQPFIVQSQGQKIEVLGTQFNVMAYQNESIVQTTLIEGSIKLESQEGGYLQLTPSKQAILNQGKLSSKVVDVSPYVAWKNGIITFNKEDMTRVIRKLERWYDVEFDAVEWPKNLHLEGEVPKNISLVGILEVLKINTGKTFIIKGRRIMITD